MLVELKRITEIDPEDLHYDIVIDGKVERSFYKKKYRNADTLATDFFDKVIKAYKDGIVGGEVIKKEEL